MNKLLTKVAKLALGLSLAAGVGVAIGSKAAERADAAGGTFTKITSLSDLTSGSKYLIVSEADNLAFDGSLSTIDAVSNTQSISISSNSITTTSDFYFTITSKSGGYSIKGSGGKYIGSTGADKNELLSDTSDKYTNTIAWDSTNSCFTIRGSNSYLIYNSTSGQTRFRYYKPATCGSGVGTGSYHKLSLFKLNTSGGTIAVTGITLSSASETIKPLKSVTLTATITPDNATTDTATWVSSDTSVATVAAGVVTGVAAGSATITAYADENGNGSLDSGEKSATCSITVQAPTTTNATVAEALTAINSLSNNDFTGDLYCVTGYVTAIQTAFNSTYGNISFWMSDTKEGSNDLEAYRTSCTSEIAAKILVGAQLKVTGNLEKYVNNNNTTPELINGKDVVILQESVNDYDEPTMKETTLAGFIGASSDKEKAELYHFTAKVKAITNSTYGNMTLTDDTNDLTVYGSTAKTEALVWNRTTGVYDFTSQNDFSSNELTSTISVGDSVEVKFIRYTYSNNVQGQGLIIDVIKAPTISVSPASMTLRVGDSAQTITVTTTNDGGASVIWTSSDSSVATVSNGTVTPVAEGTCTITAKITVNSDEYSASTTVTVNPAAIVINSDGHYTLVEDESSLQDGDIVIITNSDGSYAMSTTQNTNNRGKVASNISNDEIIISGATSIQTFQLEAYSSTFAFNTGSGYIYAASNSSNHLKTEETLDDNGKFAIDIENGEAEITAQGTNSHNIIKYNASDSIFSCYASGQSAVSIYKKTSSIDPTVVSSVTLNKASATISVGRSTSLIATINPNTALTQTVSWISSNTSVATVSANGVVVGVASGSATITAFADENSNGTLDSGEKSSTCAITVEAAVAGEWVETALASITSSDVFVIVGNNGSNYAMSNDNGTTNAPAAVAVTVTGTKITSTPAANIKWNLSVSNGSYTFYPDGDTESWLYCTNTNNGVRVGTNANDAFTLDGESGYLKHTGTSRYVGVYNSADWRCYTSSGGNIANQTFKFYKFVAGAGYTAEDFADELLDMLSTGSSAVCVANGSTNLNGLKSSWAALAGNFDCLDSANKLLLSEGNADETSNDSVEKALALYDYIATKYGHSLESSDLDDFDFIGRNIVPTGGAKLMLNFVGGENTNTIAIIVIISMVSVTAIGGYFFIKRRKVN